MNWNGNGRPLSRKKKVQLLIILTIMCWATHTLLTQWGYGAEAPAAGDGQAVGASGEKFVPGPSRAGVQAGATLELRSEATVYGGDVKLKQVCRWAERDAATFLPVAELTLARFDARASFRPITLDEIKQTLREAGVNLAVLRFSGPTQCTVRRSDVPPAGNGPDALEQWVAARRGAAPAETAQAKADRGPAAPAPGAAAVPASASVRGGVKAARPAAPAERSAPRTLREALLEDLSVRLGVPAENLEVTFKPTEDRLLNISEPHFRFSVEPVRVRGLGEVSWEVTLFGDRGAANKVPVAATCRAWQNQVVVAKPMSVKQVFRAEDIAERRVLVDRLGDDPLLTLDQALRQQASRDLKPGTVLTGRMVDAVPLAKPGQFITITLERGGIRVKTVGRATEGGSYGQAIRVKNDKTGEVYQVVLTGPQEGTIGAARPATETPGGVAALPQ